MKEKKKKISIFQIFATTEIKIVTVNTENTKPVMVKLEKKKKRPTMKYHRGVT